MNKSKKILAGALACATMAGSVGMLVGCSQNSGSGNWAVKTENATINSGVYRYALLSAYESAMYQVEDYTQPILSQKIDGKDAKEVIKEEALEYLTPFLVIEDKMKEYDLKLSDIARYNAKESAATEWQNYGQMLEGFGISQEDVQYCHYDYSAKYSEVFKHIYGEGGEKEVSLSDMKKYAQENYTDLHYLLASTSKSDGTEMSEKEITALTKKLEGYATQINAGKKTLEEVAVEYKNSLGDTKEENTDSETDTSDILMNVVTAVTTENSRYNFPETLVKSVNKAKDNTATTVDLSTSGYIVLFQKSNIKKSLTSYFDKEGENYDENVFQVLVDMKQEEYVEDMQKLADNYDKKSIEYNDDEINVDLVQLFEPESVTSETSSEDVKETASKTSSKASSEKETSSKASN